MSEISPGQAIHDSLLQSAVTHFGLPVEQFEAWDHMPAQQQKRMEDAGKAAIAAAAPVELAAAMAETRKMRDVVCKLLFLFSAADDRRMRHASVTAATLERYAAEAGVRP